jgi:2-oxoisovalerate dehydrogenase E1 component
VGRDLTIVTLGPALYTAVQAAGNLTARFGMSAEIIDLCSANRLNYQPLADSIPKTGKALLIFDAVERRSVVQTVAANLAQISFDDLDAPTVVLGSRNWITPAPELEAMFFPQPEWLIDAIHERIQPLTAHPPTTNQSLGEPSRRSRLGV